MSVRKSLQGIENVEDVCVCVCVRRRVAQCRNHGTTFTIFEDYCKMNGQRNGYTCSADTRSVMGGSE